MPYKSIIVASLYGAVLLSNAINASLQLEQQCGCEKESYQSLGVHEKSNLKEVPAQVKVICVRSERI